jgi:hypothetical protein
MRCAIQADKGDCPCSEELRQLLVSRSLRGMDAYCNGYGSEQMLNTR